MGGLTEDDLCFLHCRKTCRVGVVTQTNTRITDNPADFGSENEGLQERGSLPVSFHICALVLQENYLPGIMATHFSSGVVNDAIFVISGKQFQTASLYRLHLGGKQNYIPFNSDSWENKLYKQKSSQKINIPERSSSLQSSSRCW